MTTISAIIDYIKKKKYWILVLVVGKFIFYFLWKRIKNEKKRNNNKKKVIVKKDGKFDQKEFRETDADKKHEIRNKVRNNSKKEEKKKTQSTKIIIMTTFQWINVKPTNDIIGRSSHGVSVYKNLLVVYGGENLPRTPIDSKVWALDLSDYKNPSSLQWKELEPSKDSVVPPVRIAHTQCIIGSKLIIFGGRQSVSMHEVPLNDMYSFDLENHVWEKYSTESTAPSARSYHKMTNIGETIYVFGGCGKAGRLADLYSFDINEKCWKTLPCCEKITGRGGAGFIKSADDKSLFIVGGFSGQEMKDVYRYNIEKQTYDEIYNQEDDVNNTLRPFSVSCGAILNNMITYFGGEVDPSEKGHEGAGGFSNDLQILDGVNGTIIESSISGEKPLPRGWTDCALLSHEVDGDMLVVFGGLCGDDTNPVRLNDVWLLQNVIR